MRSKAGQGVLWVGSDALELPFPKGSFDAVASGFLIRNVVDLPRVLGEQYRVLRPGGRIVCLDTTPPPDGWLRPLITFHMHTVIPALGGLITGHRDAYAYLSGSTDNFLPAEVLAEKMRAAGFHHVGFQRLMFQTVALHWGVK
jgi:demethylmenaquinone methyltransferase/2-methoxy-6-polyprenyl-1,4-benzoquinol methylase